MIEFELIVGFDWDVGNRRKNESKHSVTIVEAEEVFFNNPLLISVDAKQLTVIFTLRQNNTLIRVISARDQHRKERNLYDQTKQ
jgi:uncharacterized DUF497 family protein